MKNCLKKIHPAFIGFMFFMVIFAIFGVIGCIFRVESNVERNRVWPPLTYQK